MSRGKPHSAEFKFKGALEAARGNRTLQADRGTIRACRCRDGIACLWG